MFKISIKVFLLFLFLIEKTFAVSSTVPTEGGYGTLLLDNGDKITGTFDRKYRWCKKCEWVFNGNIGKIVGDLHLDGEILIPRNGSILYDYNRNLIFIGAYKNIGGVWDFYSGTIEYEGKKYKSNTVGYLKAGEEVIKKHNEPQIVEKPKNKEKKKPKKKTPDDNKIVPAGSGSGFFVSRNGHAITNYHVIESCDINKLTFKGEQTEVKVLAVDRVNDIAILKSNTRPEVIFPVSNEDVSLLEDVIVAGFPLGKQISSAIKTHKGVVTALAGAGDNYSFFQTDAAINQGNSGGPIINQKGNVIGIAVQTWVEEGVQGVHFGIKSSTLKTFASANGLKFLAPNNRNLSNKELGKLITESTVYVECHMTIAKIKKMIAQSQNKKAFFSKYK